ncbi:hypothetical protein [Rhodococcus sp. B50]|uniref:hypothetical protein n=1 Tax=Rhodococcus sp. B50 TaxID=2682847 RepID=UPI001A0BA65B|nr:hypothetical protein [Rhodococcus sp. B50]
MSRETARARRESEVAPMLGFDARAAAAAPRVAAAAAVTRTATPVALAVAAAPRARRRVYAAAVSSVVGSRSGSISR